MSGPLTITQNSTAAHSNNTVSPPSRYAPPSMQLLVRRLTFGITTAELALAQSMGEEKYLNYQMYPASIDDSALDNTLFGAGTLYPTLVMDPPTLAMQTSSNVVNELIRSTIVRAVFSKRQLLERLVEFWSDHFSVWINADDVTFLKTPDDRDVIRPNALKTFPDLLRASAHSPCMLRSLNNDTNKVGRPNENYARELMELHTLSVNGGYTQSDVQEVARCFTGWGCYTSGASAYTFRYLPSDHDAGAKHIFVGTPYELNIPARAAALGQQDGEDVLNRLAMHPKTAEFVGLKLLARFWGENPPQKLRDGIKAIYLATGGDIKSMLQYIFDPANMVNVPWKFKRPFHLYASGLRSLSGTITSAASLQTPLIAAGHLPFNWQTPDGYPDTASFWSGLLLPRWNFGASLLNAEFSGVSVNATTLLAGAVTPAAIADRLGLLLHGGAMPPVDRAQLIAFLSSNAPTNPTVQMYKDATGLGVGAPGFQWY